MSNIFLLLILLSAIWGSSFFAIKISVESLDPVSVASGRLIIAAVVLYIYFRIKKLRFNPDLKTIFIIFGIGLLGNFLPFFLISWSEQFIQSNTTGLLMSVGPIFALILSHFMTQDQKFSYNKLFAILIGLTGVLFILGFGSLIGLLSNNYFLIVPKLTVILAVLGYVISSIFAYNLKKINIITLTTFVTISAAIISIPFMLFVEFHNPSTISSKSLTALIYLGLFPTAIAFLIRFHIISKAGPIYLSYVSYLIPIFAIFWGFVFLGEDIAINSLIGLFFILIGIYLGQKNISLKKN